MSNGTSTSFKRGSASYIPSLPLGGAFQVNAFKEVDEVRHRVMVTKFFFRNDQFVLFVVVNDGPHPHKDVKQGF